MLILQCLLWYGVLCRSVSVFNLVRVPRPHPRGENGGDQGTRVSGECFISLHSEPAVRFLKCLNHAAPCAPHFSGYSSCCWGGYNDCFMLCSGEGEMTRLSVEENAATLSYRLSVHLAARLLHYSTFHASTALLMATALLYNTNNTDRCL